MLEHPQVLKLVPPAELLMYFRMLAGLKGMMTRTNAEVDYRALAEACCARRGFEI